VAVAEAAVVVVAVVAVVVVVAAAAVLAAAFQRSPTLFMGPGNPSSGTTWLR
jgi:hypothetical protein